VRFAVHGPGNPVASPRSHGVPRRDVPGRVHIRVASVSAGGAPEDGLARTRLRVHPPARRAPLAGERRRYLLDSAGCLLFQTPDQQTPLRPQDAPVESSLLADVPARVLPRAFRRSGHIPDLEVFHRDHVKPVLVFSAQSLRRSVSRARSPAMASRTRLRRLEPRRARASLRSRRRSLFRSEALRPTAFSNSPVDKAALTTTPRSIPATSVLPGAGMGFGIDTNATCHRPARSHVTL
jgi:hypothetical protein